MISTLIALPYELARLPLVVVDSSSPTGCRRPPARA